MRINNILFFFDLSDDSPFFMAAERPGFFKTDNIPYFVLPFFVMNHKSLGAHVPLHVFWMGFERVNTNDNGLLHLVTDYRSLEGSCMF
jgi:hypothetical protein